MAGRVQDEGDDQHLASALCGPVEAFAEQHVGVLDEADLDAPVRVAGTPLLREVQGFLITLAAARTVADKEKGGVMVHAGFSGVRGVALRKRWPKPGS